MLSIAEKYLYNPFRIDTFHEKLITQGEALGYYIIPRWGIILMIFSV